MHSTSPHRVRVASDPGLRDDEGLYEVEAAMRALAVDHGGSWAARMVFDHLGTGGKRMRARLALAAAACLGQTRSAAVPWAAAVELLHNATLAHDDIQDGDELRRDAPTLWVRYGVGQAINAGDLMLMLPLLAVADLDTDDSIRWRLTQALGQRAAATVRGQVDEMGLLEMGDLGWGPYLDAVRGKTGQLLALPVEGAALLAGRTSAQARALGEAFVSLGVLFQLADDLLDLDPDKGRTPGTDLREGKVTALVVAHLEVHPNCPWLLDLLRTPALRTTQAEIDRGIDAFVEGGAMACVLDRIAGIRHDLATSPALMAEPRLHALASELADWIARKADVVPPTAP